MDHKPFSLYVLNNLWTLIIKLSNIRKNNNIYCSFQSFQWPIIPIRTLYRWSMSIYKKYFVSYDSHEMMQKLISNAFDIKPDHLFIVNSVNYRRVSAFHFVWVYFSEIYLVLWNNFPSNTFVLTELAALVN